MNSLTPFNAERSGRHRDLRSVGSPDGDKTEVSRSWLRSGPAFQLRTSLDDSLLLDDGTLIRSTRLARLEATLLIAGTPVSARKLVQLARLVDVKEVHQLIERLNTSYDRSRSAFRIEPTGTGFQMMTRPALAAWLDRLHHRQARMKLSQPAMETLTIIAYRQPVTRADVESIRGVQSSDLIRQLIDRGLVRVGGEDDSLGRPFLYETTRQFLDMLGLGRIQDMPDFQTLGRTAPAVEPKVDSAEVAAADEAASDNESTRQAPAA
ncbi:MAG: SMC-Scp complex subunit ScpB [Planctomycetaceae bacterium]